jgi:hypothetical protein
MAMSKGKPEGKRPGKKYRFIKNEHGGFWHKVEVRTAKKELKAVLKRHGINYKERKTIWRANSHPNRNWL